MTIKVLDCTFRDGGYYNNWDFNESKVNKYLSAMLKAKVDIVEIGFKEELAIHGDLKPTAVKKVFFTEEIYLPYEQLIPIVQNIIRAGNIRDDRAVKELLSEIVEDYIK